VASDYNAKKAVEARDKFTRETGKDSPDLVNTAASEVAAAKNPYIGANVAPPQWLANE
jgi:hypothetical protein